jgi:predicted transcriptional regulator
MKTLQVNLDEDTARLLDTLAAPRAGNRSLVVGEAVRRMAEQEGFEKYLDWLEQVPKVHRTLVQALNDERAGRTARHATVVRAHSGSSPPTVPRINTRRPRS